MKREQIIKTLNSPQSFKNIKTGQVIIILGGWFEIALKGGLKNIIKSDWTNWYNLKCIE